MSRNIDQQLNVHEAVCYARDHSKGYLHMLIQVFYCCSSGETWQDTLFGCQLPFPVTKSALGAWWNLLLDTGILEVLFNQLQEPGNCPYSNLHIRCGHTY